MPFTASTFDPVTTPALKAGLSHWVEVTRASLSIDTPSDQVSGRFFASRPRADWLARNQGD